MHTCTREGSRVNEMCATTIDERTHKENKGMEGKSCGSAAATDMGMYQIEIVKLINK